MKEAEELGAQCDEGRAYIEKQKKAANSDAPLPWTDTPSRRPTSTLNICGRKSARGSRYRAYLLGVGA